MTKQKSITVLAEGLAAERELIVDSYASELKTLAGRIAQAQERLARTTGYPISSHDAHNMASTLQEMARLAGRYEEFMRFASLARVE